MTNANDVDELKIKLIDIFDDFSCNIMLLQNEIYLLINNYYETDLLDKRVIIDLVAMRVDELRELSRKHINLF